MGAFAVPLLTTVAGTLLSSALQKKDKGDAPSAPPAPKAAEQAAAAPPTPAAAQTPSPAAFSAANVTSALAGPSSTNLSGVGGIDPSLLRLGRNTLLGA